MEDTILGKVNIAIDGPAGAGKSTIAKIISKSLGIIYLDTGAMYRTVALKAINEGIDTLDKVKLARIVENIDIKIKYTGDVQHIYLDGEDVSTRIRTPEISIGASNVAVVPEVRIKMVQIQRDIASMNDVVMDGRDIGSYVLPKAELKIFLTASVEERAKRRYNELIEKGNSSISLDEVKKDIEYRDNNDSSRDFAPLIKADDAIEVDTTSLSIEDVAKKIMSYIKK